MSSRRVAFLFPGQGAQEVGMGRDLFAKDRLSASWIALASDLVGVDLKTLCVRGPAWDLDETANLQPALTAVCLGLWRRLEDEGVMPDMVAGHSIGELSALTASGMAKPADMVALAATRGHLMGEAAAKRAGAMVAVSGTPISEIEAALEPFRRDGSLSLAAVNAPSQLTVSGDADAVDAFTRGIAPKVGFKISRLKVSGAWHSHHMEEAAALFRDAVDKLDLRRPVVPMVFNRYGETASDVATVRALIAEQLVRPVRWDKVVTTLIENGVTDFVEIGPGKVLRGLLRLNTQDPSLTVHNVSDLRSLKRTLDALAG